MKQVEAVAPPTLRELQDGFQRAILEGDDAVLAQVLDNSRTGRDTLFGVYRNAYVGRLVEILQNDHELTHAYLGDDQFRAMAEAYVAAHPSHTQNARWFSAALPRFLATTEPYCDHRHLEELAMIEKALNSVFDAADAPVLAIAQLAAIPPEHWSELALTPHPATVRLDDSTNALAIWSALKNEADVPDAQDLDEPDRLIVWRSGATPMIRPMSAEEAMMWDEAAKGVRFGVLCELVATYDDPDGAALRAAQYLQGWIVNGMLTRADVGGA